jgi:hypothetical protein
MAMLAAARAGTVQRTWRFGETRVIATFIEGVAVHEAPGLDG